MSLPEILTAPIAEWKRTPAPQARLTRDGYTKLSGSPSTIMLRLDREKRWRRLMVWQFSNMPTSFVRMRGRSLIVPSHLIPSEI